VRSPFVRRGASLGERPSGENPGIMRGAIFSEGRGLRARVARPDASAGQGMMVKGKRTPGGQEEATLELALCLPCGRAEPAPPGA